MAADNVFGGSIVITPEDFLEDQERREYIAKIQVRGGVHAPAFWDRRYRARKEFMAFLWREVLQLIQDNVWHGRLRKPLRDFLRGYVKKEAEEFGKNGEESNSFTGALALKCLVGRTGLEDTLADLLVDALLLQNILPDACDMKAMCSFLQGIFCEFPSVVPDCTMYIEYTDRYTEKLIQKQTKCMRKGRPLYFNEYTVKNCCGAGEDICRSLEENIGKVVAYYGTVLSVPPADNVEGPKVTEWSVLSCPIYIENDEQFKRSCDQNEVTPQEIIRDINMLLEYFGYDAREERRALEDLRELIEEFSGGCDVDPEDIMGLITDPQSPISRLIGKRLKQKICKLLNPSVILGVFQSLASSAREENDSIHLNYDKIQEECIRHNIDIKEFINYVLAHEMYHAQHYAQVMTNGGAWHGEEVEDDKMRAVRETLAEYSALGYAVEILDSSDVARYIHKVRKPAQFPYDGGYSGALIVEVSLDADSPDTTHYLQDNPLYKELLGLSLFDMLTAYYVIPRDYFKRGMGWS